MKNFFAGLIMIVFLSGCAAVVPSWNISPLDIVEGNGDIIDVIVPVPQGTDSSRFNVFSVHNTFINVILTNNLHEEIRFSIDSNLAEYIEVLNNNGVLVVRTAEGISISPSDRTLDIYINSSSLASMQKSGAGRLTTDGVFTIENLSMNLSGAFTADMDVIIADTFQIQQLGAGSMEARGRATNLDLLISGASSTNLSGLIAQNAEVTISGAASATVYVEESLDASVSGVGSITYFGNPSTVQASTAGVGSITRGD